ncbi:MAG: transcription antitermination factor NusB [Chlamydiae bacterium RIFCSPHIGHO2_12_FULL_44_59]|nr:MAG: transcription antitermination factor NusB [Chlamydiae bacterium RIFCSPHIGHO2_01_FULL_44_39]OGN57663.1 MAG: transcription antitermination factor NusB [Chlamydiae bacterium RIFCSPHIGHO2_02_FULL_45_9]OGN60211.1 MAG: transcription antitermination factor NusB [Chlamydiae bacterium RIFCSPHIGHO2_12_FULL_44_59]OGN67135.1 MAG: transcription antitermination factor NusB [Chlamydiae bacterium RIFCSPLOWO2_01_FULL_44_52]OGN67725.1 MAG: transcription antitermination factor NusB [Chlamydiae bacterium R
MALPNQKMREAVLQILYAREFDDGDVISFMMAELKTTRAAITQVVERVDAVCSKLGEIDTVIASTSTEYRLERISKVEKSILRLALYELMFDTAIPPKVSIAEAIRLCRKFGTPESARFINAIVDGVYKNDLEIGKGEEAL